MVDVMSEVAWDELLEQERSAARMEISMRMLQEPRSKAVSPTYHIHQSCWGSNCERR